LTCALLPAARGKLSDRAVDELKTLARTIDLQLKGKIVEGLDVLIQRFKAVELSSSQGWQIAKHLQLIPASEVSSVGQREADYALEAQRKEIKSKAQSELLSARHR